jgi:uncharacterized membrane protein YbhN (UPF0104 family)
MRRLLALLETTPGRILRYAFSVLLVAAFAWQVDWRQFASLPGQFAPAPAVLGALSAGILFPLHAWRWWLLLRSQGLALSLHWAHVVTWIGNFYNAFLLGSLGGDAAKAFYVCRDAPTRQAAGLAATLLDRIMGLVVLVNMAAAGLLLKLDLVASHPDLRLLLILSIAVFVTGGVGFVILCRRPPDWIVRRLGATHAASLADILQRASTARGAMIAALAMSYVIWFLDFLAVWLLARSVGLPLPFLDVCLAVSIAYAATVLPVSVGGHGVREGTLLAMLTLMGFLPDAETRQHALLLAVLFWGVSVLWSLVGGGVLLGARRWRPVTKA